MVEEILARVERERLSVASINNQGGFDMPAEQAFVGGAVPERCITGKEETTHSVKELAGRASFRAPRIPDFIRMALGPS